MKRSVTLLTGGTGYLGRALISRIKRSWLVVGRSQERLSELRTRFPEIDVYAMDINDEQSIRAFVDYLRTSNYEVDGLVNNAAARPSLEYLSSSSKSLEWDSVLRANVTAPGLLTESLADLMSDFSSVVNISSIYGSSSTVLDIYSEEDRKQMFFLNMIYGVSKAALDHMTRYFATYYGFLNKNVRVNAICLGGIENQQPTEFKELYSGQTAAGKGKSGMITLEEASAMVEFLLSRKSSGVNGQVIAADKGWRL